MKLRLRSEDALRLLTAAREANVDLSEYVGGYWMTRSVRLRRACRCRCCRWRTCRGWALSEEARRARGELGRAFGLAKHLFEMPATDLNAERHSFELSETTRDARAAIQNVDASVDRLLNEFASSREDWARRRAG